MWCWYDFTLLGFKTSCKVIPIAGTVNVTRIQSLIKAVELDLEKKIGLPSGRHGWRCTLNWVQIAFLKNNNEINKNDFDTNDKSWAKQH
jgi:hypothetical protein